MFVNTNRNKRRPTGTDVSTPVAPNIAVPFDPATPEVYLAQLKTLAENEAKRGALLDHLPRLYAFLDSTSSLPALEILFLLAQDGSNLPTMAASEGLLDKLDAMKTIGQLKQKRLASTTYDKLKPYAQAPKLFSDSTNVSDVGLGSVTSKVTTVPVSSFARRGEENLQPVTTSYPAKNTATTITLFLENVDTEEGMAVIENCLLGTKGVVSFFSDVSDQRLVVRSSVGADELVKVIYQETHHRASTIKGSYDGAGPQYLHKAGDTREGGWFSSLYQIITPGSVANSSSSNTGAGWFGAWF